MNDTMIRVNDNKLKLLRLGLGLTQNELAEKVGVSPDTLVRWERGRGTNPRAPALRKIAAALDVSPADLLEVE
jgi:transcriptional regulator with XRE-family HTH domain